MIPFARVVFADALRRTNSADHTASHLARAMTWLAGAQDATTDGGVSEGFHLLHGWLPSYPETTGYIIGTFLDYARAVGDGEWRDRALRMADWLVSVQDADGAIRDATFGQKMVFDTGQALFGLLAAYRESRSERYLDAAVRAGTWLCEVQDPAGPWISFAVGEIPHTYYSRVAWGLLVLNESAPDARWVNSAVLNCEWVMSQQDPSGWFRTAGFRAETHSAPFTHTLAYTIRGMLECGLALSEPRYVSSARCALDQVVRSLPRNGRLPGTYDRNWAGDASFSCLTGNAQMAIAMMKLYLESGEQEYWAAAQRINQYLSRKQFSVDVAPQVAGALAGSDPCWGKYIRFCFPNWAAKFFAESLMLELEIVGRNGIHK